MLKKFHLLPIAMLLCIQFSMAQGPVNKDKNEPQTIARIWNGWTSAENANELERLFTKEIIPSFQKELPNGFRGIQLFRSEEGEEVKFTTIMLFNSMEAIKEFAGPVPETSHIDPKVAPLLTRFDKKVVHSQLKFSSY